MPWGGLYFSPSDLARPFRSRARAGTWSAMLVDLSDQERATLAAFLHRLIDEARYPYAPALQPLRSVLAKLEPPAPRLEPGVRR